MTDASSYGFYDNPTDYTINDLDFLALAESTDYTIDDLDLTRAAFSDPADDAELKEQQARNHRRAFMMAAFSDPADDAELEETARNRSPDELIFEPAPSEWPRARAAGILARGNDPRTLDALARGCRFAEVLAFVSHNPATPADTQRLLIQNEYAIICQGAAQHLPMTEEIYDLAAPCARVTLVCRPDVTETIVHRAATDPHPDARMVAAAHALADPADLAVLITDEEAEVAEQAAANLLTPVEALAAAMSDPRQKVRAGLAANPALPLDELRALVDYAVHLVDTSPPCPFPADLSDDEVRAALDAHDTAGAILRAVVQRDDLDASTATLVWEYRYRK